MWIYVFVGTLFVKGIICQDPCNPENHQLLKDPTRSVNHILGQHEADKCDRRFLTEGWYRIPENGNIATDCPALLRCGSLYPIWLNGTLPSRGARLTIKACQRGFINCCQNTFSVEVQHCNEFNVFYLTTIPACPGRYCTVGPPAPCPPGMASETGFQPCQNLDISFSVSPTVKGFISKSNSGQNNLAFRCNVAMPSKYKQYFFDVVWYINQNEIVKKQKLQFSDLDTNGSLYRTDWDSHPNGPKVLGFWVVCCMSARRSSTSVPTPCNSSKEFYAGAQLEETSFRIKSGKEVIIKIKSTVPVACFTFQGRTECSIAIELFSLKDQVQSIPANCNESSSDVDLHTTASSCGLTFDGTKWGTYHSFTLRTLSDQTKRQSYTCKAKLISNSNTDTLWQNYQLPEVSIHVFNEKKPTGVCMSQNDPQVYSFDGKKFITHEKGEFVLYRNKEKPIEVHTIHRFEYGQNYYRHWGSNCAIMIRAATDMFVIYGCNSPTRWITRRLNCNSGQQYLEVFERGKNFEVILPTGTLISIDVRSTWLNIHITLSQSEWNQTEGLCGNHNGNAGDDFTTKNGKLVGETAFVKSWEVPGDQSLFVAKSRAEKMKTQVLYCSCYNKSNIAGIANTNEKTADCAWKENLPQCKPLNYKENKCHIYGRTKREIEDDFEFDVPLEVIKYEEGPKVFEWENGWTEQKAINACGSHFKNSKLFQLCSKITHSSNDDIKTCVNDIKMSGSDIFLSASLDSMRSACVNELRTNTTFWKPKPRPPLPTTTERTMQSSMKPSPTTTTTTTERIFDIADIADIEVISILDIAELVFNNDCPNDCSESGTCQQGTCECDDGFEGDDCSIDQRKEPEVFGLFEESFCDLSKRHCSFVSLFGKGFYESGIVKCRVIDAKIELNEVKPKTLNVTTDGSLIAFAEVKCPLGQIGVNKLQTFPVLDAFLVSVSFDDIKYSTGSPIIVYDSTCTICKGVKGNVDCKMREDVCIVERKCYNQEHTMCKPSTTFAPFEKTTSSEILYETSHQTTSSEILYETSEQTTSSEMLYETSEQTTSSEMLYETSEQTTSSEMLYATSEQTTSSEKLYETSEQTTSSEKLYETSETTPSLDILYETSKQTTSSEKLYETNEQTTSAEKPFTYRETTTSLDILNEINKQTTSSETLYEHSKQTISPEIFYLGAVLGGLGIVVVPTLLLIRRM